MGLLSWHVPSLNLMLGGMVDMAVDTVDMAVADMADLPMLSPKLMPNLKLMPNPLLLLMLMLKLMLTLMPGVMDTVVDTDMADTDVDTEDMADTDTTAARDQLMPFL